MRTVEEHLGLILDTVRPLPPYDQPLLDSLGLPLCEDVFASFPLPSFDNSAMDGYAVRSVDVAGAGADTPVALPVVGEIAAGTGESYALGQGTALKIMTGAPMPSGADAVVPVEDTDRGIATVQIHRQPAVDQHVRHAGEDIEAGTRVLEEGRVIGVRETALLAALGHGQVRARPRPRLVVLSTGSELREPGTGLGRDSVYDSNSYMLAAAARRAGATPYRVGVVPDDPQQFSDALSDQLVRADLVVTSGGVSKGEYDIVKEVLSTLGTVQFAEVAMQPGKPQGFGTVGDDDTPVFTLPGNPVSSYVSFEVFVVPALRRMMGRLPYKRPRVVATLTNDLTSPPGKEQYLRGNFGYPRGEPEVATVGGPGSHLLGGLADSNALIVIPAETTSLSAGDRVSVLVVDREF